ncbi:MAG: PbpA [Desulfobacterales bacterium]|nr:PbpA [Desulfobacterales bacterium]
MYTFKKENSWRQHQSDFILERRKRTLLRSSTRVVTLIGLITGLIIGGVYLFNLDLTLTKKTGPSAPELKSEPSKTKVTLSKPALRKLLRDTAFINAGKDIFFVDTPSESYTVRTRLDTRLQASLNATLARLKTLTRGKPQRIAMVALDNNTGFIKAMAGFDLDNPGANPVTASDYPAASIFKIVSAAAAVDALGYTAGTPLFFNGNKYTLYKRQLTDKRNKYTTRVTLGKAFADSINPVFGKIGQLYLGRDKLNTYAHKFGFNQNPDTDFDFSASRFSVTESDYHLAELGCGFNRQTEISPVFATMMVSAILNRGSALVPRLVADIESSDQDLIYKSRKEVYKTPIAQKSAGEMIRIMKKTISSGTARKSFRGFSRDRVLSKLTLGGKTGSLYNKERTVKYDWFTGFGAEKNMKRALVVAVVVGHRKYIGTRASTHARNMLKTYFSPVSGAKK